MSDPLVPVAVACPCPGTPHDGDSVYLYPKLSLRGGTLAQRKFVEMLNGTPDHDEVFTQLIEVYVRNTVAETTFVDEAGETLDREASIEILLADFEIGKAIANKADEMFSKGLLDPLLEQVSKSSLDSPTNGSTSRRTSSSATPRKRSKRSSTTTSQTADTSTTSP